MQAGPRSSERLVLLVEDDRDVRDAVREVLEDAGYRVLTAATGGEALERLGSEVRRPDVILLDIRMPILDGCQFRQLQLLNPAWREIPVVVLSAEASVARRAAALGAVAHMRKPVEIGALLEVVGRFAGLPEPARRG